MTALMEWQVGKDAQVARNIFEVGMSKFPNNAAFVLEYLKFLLHLNEENSTAI
jgi:cleavage stimulation factor subunit 3